MNIADLFSERAQLAAQSTAVVDMVRRRPRITRYVDLDAAAGEFAAQLRMAGLKPGEPVLVLCPMSLELYITLIAILRLGLVAVFLDPGAGRRHVHACCECWPPRAFVGARRAHALRLFMPCLRRIPIQFSVDGNLPGTIRLRRDNRLCPIDTTIARRPEDPALLSFTSGTGGLAKAALRTHGFLLAQFRALRECLQLETGQTDLCTLPMFVLANLAAGRTSVIPPLHGSRPESIEARSLVELLSGQHASEMGGSPVMMGRLIDHCTRFETQLPHLRRIYVGGGPVYSQLLERLREIAPHASVTAVYGSTEAEPIACLQHDEISQEDQRDMLGGRGILAGRPAPMIDLRIMHNQWGSGVGPYSKAEFEQDCMPPGSAGEIVVSGSHVLPGYLDPAEDWDTKFTVDGVKWHRTGDAGFLDATGRLWLLGRCSGCISNSQQTLYPFSVEQIALREAAIDRAAMVLVGEHRVLVVESTAGRLAESERKRLLQTFAFADVQRLQVLKRIPVDKRHSAKIDYLALKRRLERIG